MRSNRRWLVAGMGAVALTSALFAGPSVPSAVAAPGDGAWQITLDKVAPDPVESGVPSSFVLSIQCSALEAPACLGGVVTIPLPEHVRPTVDVDPHPFVVGRTIVGNALQLTLAPSLPAGASLQVGLRFTAANITTPNGYSPTFTATATGSNTPAASDSATATFTATPTLGVTKRLPANAPNGTAFPLDTTMRYTMSVCDTRGLGAVGVLGMESVTVVDTLPPGATFVAASAGGVHDPGTGTVTWQLDAQTEFCYDTLSVDVEYVTGDVDPAATVTNSVTVTGRPIAGTTDLTASASVNHTFGNPVAAGNFCKTSTSFIALDGTPPCGSDVDAITYIGPWLGEHRDLSSTSGSGRSESSFMLLVENSSVATGTFDLVEPVPCMTNSNGATPATYTSNDPGDICTDPAWVVTGIKNIGVFPTSGFAQAILAGNYPTYVTTSGEVRQFDAHPDTASTGAATWLFTPQAGDVVAEIRWTDVPAPPGVAGRASRARVHGYLDSDLNVGDRAVNVAERTLNIGASELTNTAAASLIATDETVVHTGKSMTLGGTFDLRAGAISASQPSVWRSGLVLADLLPAEVPAVALVHATYSPGPITFEPMPPTAYRIEQIPDYQGSGRTLLRVTVPPGVELASHPVALTFRFRPADGGPFPWIGTRVNTVRTFAPGEAIDRCTTGYVFQDGAGPATDDSDDWDGDGVTTGDQYCSGSVNLTRASGGAAIQTTKQVRGNLDSTYAAYPKVALTDPSLPGDAGYRVEVRNSGGAALRDAVLYDVLPAVGDTGVSATQAASARGSTFRPALTGQVTVASDPSVTWEVAYSTAAVPCRPEVGDGSPTWPAGCTADWSTTAPADLSTVTALRFRQTAGVLTPDAGPTNRATFSWPMSTPPSAEVGDIAWNTTATVATNDATGVALLASEPPKVGLTVPATDVELTKVADRASGAVGEEVTYTVTASHGTTIVTNADGSVSYVNDGSDTTAVAPATGVVVTDVLPAGLTLVAGSVVAQQGTFDAATGVWNVGTLDVGATTTLTYRATITAAGTHVNQAEVSALGVQDVDSAAANCAGAAEDDCATATVDVLPSDISLVKLVESAPATGDFLDADQGSTERGIYPSGSPTQYRFTVTNTGQTELANVVIVDPLIPFFCDATFQIGTLAPGASSTVDCTLPIGFGVGTTVNTATVTASTPGGATVEATDTAQVVVPTPAITVEKTTNGMPAATPAAAVRLDVGDAVTWRYVVRNSGTDALVDLTLADDREGDVTLDPASCARSSGVWGDPLPPAATITCTFAGQARSGPYANTATASGRGVTTPIVVTGTDISHYTTVAGSPTTSTPSTTPSTTTPPTTAPPTSAPSTTAPHPGPSTTGWAPPTTVFGVSPAAPPPSTPPPPGDPGGWLPVTGSQLGTSLVIGASLLGIGLLLASARRRQRPEDVSAR